MTVHALKESPWPGGQVPPQSTLDDMQLSENLPFQVPKGASLWDMSMLMGVRDNDTHGHAMSDLPELAGVHNGNPNQSEHCLRSEEQKFEEGDRQALEACRAFIHGEIEKATSGALSPDMKAVSEIPLELRFQSAQLTVSRYGFHMGRALHALQDSFAHSFRTTREFKVAGVLNYVDFAQSPTFSAARDGHAHLSVLDSCEGRTEFDVQRIDAAKRFSASLLQAVAAEAGSLEERKDRVDAVLDEALAYTPGCRSENQWCGTLENVKLLEEAAWGCSSSRGVPSFVFYLGLVWLVFRRRR